MYIIFGCGATGNAVVDALNKAGKDILIIDKDESALSSWSKKNLNVIVSDIETFNLDSQHCKSASVFAILTGDSKGNLSLAMRIKKKMPDNFVLVKASSQGETEALESSGADMILQTGNVLAQEILFAFKTVEMEHSASTLVSVIKE